MTTEAKAGLYERVPEFRYDAEAHEYFLNGKRLPHITGILASVGIIDSTWFSEESAWRGSVIHAACQLDDEGDLDEASVDEEAKPYLAAWRLAKEQLGLAGERALIEKPMFSLRYGFAGMPDREYPRRKLIVDLKSGGHYRWHALQLAAQAQLVSCHLSGLPFALDLAMFARVAVHLQKNGKYDCRVYPRIEIGRDWEVFLAALRVCHWKEQV